MRTTELRLLMAGLALVLTTSCLSMAGGAPATRAAGMPGGQILCNA